MIPWSLASARRIVLRPSFLLHAAIAVSLIYALSLIAFERDPRRPGIPTVAHRTILTSLLFGSSDTADTYLVSATKSSVARRTINTPQWRERGAPILVGDDQFLLRTETGSQVLRTSGTARYTLPSSSIALLSTITRSNNFELSTVMQNNALALRIRHVPCDRIVTIPLDIPIAPNRELMRDDALNLRQRILRISPFETSVVILDSALSQRITIVNLFTHAVSTLDAPTFSPNQRHFSPTFLDEDTLLFSVLDGDRMGTVVYRIPENRASLLSEYFTDRAFVSTTGDIVLLQSFYDDGKTNVPFGSLPFYEKRRAHGIDYARLEPVIGQSIRAQVLRDSLFSNPDAAELHFKDTLTEEDFRAIEDADTRNFLLALWRDQRFLDGLPRGQQHILKGTVESLETIGSVPFVVNPGKATFEWKTDVSPLLQALDIPEKLVKEYERRSRKFAEQNQTYELVDALW